MLYAVLVEYQVFSFPFTASPRQSSFPNASHACLLGILSSSIRSSSVQTYSQCAVSLSFPPTWTALSSHISLPPATREPLIKTYLSTLPPAPEGAAYSAEEEAERAKKLAERERREKALADRERRVREEKRKQERDLAYGKGRLREEEEEIQRALNVGKEGLKKSLEE